MSTFSTFRPASPRGVTSNHENIPRAYAGPTAENYIPTAFPTGGQYLLNLCVLTPSLLVTLDLLLVAQKSIAYMELRTHFGYLVNPQITLFPAWSWAPTLKGKPLLNDENSKSKYLLHTKSQGLILTHIYDPPYKYLNCLQIRINGFATEELLISI